MDYAPLKYWCIKLYCFNYSLLQDIEVFPYLCWSFICLYFISFYLLYNCTGCIWIWFLMLKERTKTQGIKKKKISCIFNVKISKIFIRGDRCLLKDYRTKKETWVLSAIVNKSTFPTWMAKNIFSWGLYDVKRNYSL